MNANPTTTVENDPPEMTAGDDDGDELLEEDLLVEDVSIDGMCGVY